MGKSKTTTTKAGPDAASQAYIDQLRQQAQGGANVALQGPEGGGGFFTGAITPEQIQAAMNPFMSNVVDATRGEFDHLRGQALTGANQMATQAGAFGGSRHGVMAGARLGELDRAQGSTIADLLRGGFSQAQEFAKHQQGLTQQAQMEPLWRQQQALQMMNFGMGPVGMNTTSTEKGNAMSTLGSLAGTAAGIYMMGRGGGLFGGGQQGPPPAPGFQPHRMPGVPF